MADWRRSNRTDRIWQGALFTSCMVHLCVVAGGWMLFNKVNKLPDMRSGIQVSLIKLAPQPPEPKPLPVSKPTPVEPVSTRQALPPSKEQNTLKTKKMPPVTAPPPPEKKQPEIKTVKKQAEQPKPLPAPDTLPHTPQAAMTEQPQPPARDNEKSAEATAKAKPPADPEPLSAASSSILQAPPVVTTLSSPLPTPPTTQQRTTQQANLQVAVREGYLILLRERIERYKKYPLMARKGRQQGVVLVEFELSAAGHLKSCQIRESCGHRLLDRAALQAVATAAPFPEVPPEIELTGNSFVLPVRFTIGR